MKPQHEYWSEAAHCIQQTTQTDHLREGTLASLIVFKAVSDDDNMGSLKSPFL